MNQFGALVKRLFCLPTLGGSGARRFLYQRRDGSPSNSILISAKLVFADESGASTISLEGMGRGRRPSCRLGRITLPTPSACAPVLFVCLERCPLPGSALRLRRRHDRRRTWPLNTRLGSGSATAPRRSPSRPRPTRNHRRPEGQASHPGGSSPMSGGRAGAATSSSSRRLSQGSKRALKNEFSRARH